MSRGGPWSRAMAALSVAGVVAIVVVSSCVARAAVLPLSNCYALDSDSRLYDLSGLYGREFEKDVGRKTYVLRFCKDFQERSQDSGYVSFGAYRTGAMLWPPASAGRSFAHLYTGGDLSGCEEHGTEFNGRDAEVAVVCGGCPSGATCDGASGCICSVDFDAEGGRECGARVVLAVPCPDPGPRVVSGLTVGFSPRGQEVVADGLTQWGFESDRHADFSFDTLQSRVFLYFSAPSRVAEAIGQPALAGAANGLEVSLSGTAVTGVAPTTLAPSLLEVNWRCESVRSFAVNVTVPVKDYDSISFSLLKLCSATQTEQGRRRSGWATFGVLSCIFFLMTGFLCCGGFLYRTRVENKRGLEALPGISVLSSCLDAASRDSGGGYTRADEGNAGTGGFPLRGGSTANARAGQMGFDGRYGSVQ